MATTSLSLGDHWELFIKNEVGSGRYGSASEVVRDALRTMEERKAKLEALQAHLIEGAKQAKPGNLVGNFSMDSLMNDLDNEA
jgi:antitoxin ParD1/3/4